MLHAEKQEGQARAWYATAHDRLDHMAVVILEPLLATTTLTYSFQSSL